MYSGIKNIKVNNRNRSSSYFSKRCSSNANTKNSFGLSKLVEEDRKLKLKLTPLLISSTSWIVVSPNEMDSFKSGFNLNVKRDKCKNGVKISRSSINNNSNFFKNCYMYGNKWAKQREIASLTKIMTCYTVLKLIERYKLNKHMTLVTVSKRASCEVGTTAHLEEGHSFSVWDLLHALMLPSGNDAAIALAEHFGNFLINEEEKELNTKIFIKRPLNDISTTKDIRSVNESDYIVLPEIKIRQDRELLSESCLREPKCLLNHAYGCDVESSYSLGINSCSMSYSESFSYKDRFKSLFKDSKSISRFIKEMNSDAKKIKLDNTHFDSPHGLSNSNNVSTAYDIALLCSVCVRNLDFSRITRTKSYVCKSRNNIGVQLSRVVTKDYTWANTNKLLEEGFIGIKTGVTYPAGPCFAAHLKSKNRSFIVPLFRSKILICKKLLYFINNKKFSKET